VSGGTSDTLSLGDSHNHLHLDIPATVTTVTALLGCGREEQAHLDELQAQSLMSKIILAFSSVTPCQSDEVMPLDEQQLDQLIEWKNALLDFTTVLPHLAEDLIHDGRVLNIDP